jgi:S-adenosylmethionine synthetase
VKKGEYFFSSESVTEGHPDKICDQISDAVLDAIYKDDPMAKVACECAVTTGLVLVMGEITTKVYVDISKLARSVIKDIGYTRAKYGFDGDTCGVIVTLDEQSPDIRGGVDDALEVRGAHSEDEIAKQGAGDQGMMFGYAARETPELMPLPISLAHALTRRLAQVRKEGLTTGLRPDGKSQVTVRYVDGKPVDLHTILVSSQHSPKMSQEDIYNEIEEHVIKAVIPKKLMHKNTRILVNPSGRFVEGGPKADSGLTGRKIIVDTYGGSARHGGGAFSGKDPTKVDRSASYASRWVAKNIVKAGIADRCEIQLSYAIGVAEPLSINVNTFGTGKIDEAKLLEIIRSNFDLRPGAIIRDLDLRNPVYRQVASYGHFGRPDLDLSWERTDKADQLKRDAGI